MQNKIALDRVEIGDKFEATGHHGGGMDEFEVIDIFIDSFGKATVQIRLKNGDTESYTADDFIKQISNPDNMIKRKSDVPQDDKKKAEDTTMKQADYNGWKNYETWNCKLWLDNDGMGDAILDEINSANLNSVEEVAEYIEGWVNDNNPNIGPSMFGDLLNASLAEINYREIAEAFWEERDKDEEPVATE